MKQIFFMLFFSVGASILIGCGPKVSEVSPTPPSSLEEDTSIPSSSNATPQIIDLTAETFVSFIQSDEKVLVDFWAPWCSPCRKQGEALRQWSDAGKLPSVARIGKVNIDEQPKLAEQFNIQVIPALFVFQKGEIVQQFMGFQDEETLANALQ